MGLVEDVTKKEWLRTVLKITILIVLVMLGSGISAFLVWTIFPLSFLKSCLIVFTVIMVTFLPHLFGNCPICGHKKTKPGS